jgi:hypothetical protein
VSLRDYADANVLIEDVDTGEVLGEVNNFDAQPILHPHAIYMHRGDTYRVETLDLDRNLARVKRVEVDYYTQPIGGTDIHHIDHCLREKPFGTGRAFWGEVTAYFRTVFYEKIHFYELDAISRHPLDLPTMSLESHAFWIVPPEDLMADVRRAGLDAHAGLRAIGYATRMLLPLFMTCDTLDFSHTIGSVNSPWNAVFIYERYPLGLGFTAHAYEQLDRILPAVLRAIETCPCDEGCPCCVGKPLRQYATWNVERHEGSIPSKAAAQWILRGLLAGGEDLALPDEAAMSDTTEADDARLRKALQRRLERMREPRRFHAINADIRTEYPELESESTLDRADVARRAEKRSAADRDLHKRLARKMGLDGLDPYTSRPGPPAGMKIGHVRTPRSFPGRPSQREHNEPVGADDEDPQAGGAADRGDTTDAPMPIISLGDSLAARARRRRRQQDDT